MLKFPADFVLRQKNTIHVNQPGEQICVSEHPTNSGMNREHVKNTGDILCSAWNLAARVRGQSPNWVSTTSLLNQRVSLSKRGE